MLRRLANTLSVSAIGLLCLTFGSSLASASNTDVVKGQETDAATSLKTVLGRAGEQGLIQVDGVTPIPRTTSQNQGRRSSGQTVPHLANCDVSDVFDYSTYINVSSFDDVLETKNAITSFEKTSDIMVLAKQYISLGLGTETVALASAHTTLDASVLAALGRIVDGVPSEQDLDLITAHEDCTTKSKFWAQVARASHEFGNYDDKDWTLSLEQRKILLEMPEHLKFVLITRLGIHAAEMQKATLADQLLALVEPQSRRGLLPVIQSDERLYLFALVRQMKGDPTAEQILKYLGQSDGVYQTRALLKLVKHATPEDQGLYDEFSAELLSVQQQYRGSAPSRKASLEVVKHQVGGGHYIYAIDLAKEEFSTTDTERVDAVNVIGDHLKVKLAGEDKHQKLQALNGYMYNPAFFLKHHDLTGLKSQAYKSAIDLKLPELALQIPKDIVETSDDHTKSRRLAETQASYKRGDYKKAVELSENQKDDERYQAVLVQSALKLESQLMQARVAKRVTDEELKTKYQANVALQNSRWTDAQSALKTLAEKDADDVDTKAKLAIVDYVVSDKTGQETLAKSDTVADMETFNKELNADIDLVKAYLKNG